MSWSSTTISTKSQSPRITQSKDLEKITAKCCLPKSRHNSITSPDICHHTVSLLEKASPTAFELQTRASCVNNPSIIYTHPLGVAEGLIWVLTFIKLGAHHPQSLHSTQEHYSQQRTTRSRLPGTPAFTSYLMAPQLWFWVPQIHTSPVFILRILGKYPIACGLKTTVSSITTCHPIMLQRAIMRLFIPWTLTINFVCLGLYIYNFWNYNTTSSFSAFPFLLSTLLVHPVFCLSSSWLLFL